MKTLIAMVRVPDNMAEGMKYGKGSLVWWAADSVGASWEGDFDDDGNGWGKEVGERFGCSANDRATMEGFDAGFVDADGEAERAISKLIAERADADK